MTGHRLLFRGGHVVTADSDLGTVEHGEVLVEDDLVVAVGRDLGVTDAEIVDARGRIIAPGTVDTHRHTWQCQLRGVCSDLSLQQYIFGFWPDATSSYEPADVRIGNLVGALEALDAGVTTVLDFCHVTNSPDHADAGVTGLEEAGIRAVFAYGLGQSDPMAPPAFDKMADLRRIAGERFPSTERLVTLGVALSEIGLAPISTTRAQKQLADELGAVSTAHVGANWALPTGIAELAAAGVLDPSFVLAHATTLSDEDWKLAAEAGVKVSTSPQTELAMGMGRLAVDRITRLGLAPTLGVDVVSLASGDLWSQARLALTFTRWARSEPVTESGQDVATVSPSAAEAVAWATSNGAEALGLGRLTGSLTPGKQADLVVVGGAGPGSRPVHDPAGQLVFQTTAAQVESVLVAGRFVKRDGVLVGVDLPRLLSELEESAARVTERIAATAAAKSPPAPDMFAAFPAWFAANLAS